MQQSSCNGRWIALVLHPHDAAQALPLEHQVEGRVDLRERHAVGDELLHLQLLHTGDSHHKFDPSENMSHTTMNTSGFHYFPLCLLVANSAVSWSYYLLHVHLDDVGQVGAGLVVAEEGTLERLLIQKVHGVGLELVLPVRDTDQHGDAPSLNLHFRASLLVFQLKP